LSDLEQKAGGVIIVVPSDQTEKAVRQAIDAKIPRIWIQQGSESSSAIALCKEKGIPTISGECIMMFADPVKSFHSFHRFIWKLLGKYPK